MTSRPERSEGPARRGCPPRDCRVTLAGPSAGARRSPGSPPEFSIQKGSRRMPDKRPRRPGSVLFAAAAMLALAACATKYPNSTFDNTTDFNTDIHALWDRLLMLGTIVFVFVEGLLLYTIIRYRRREGAPLPKPVHGHAGLEITWTIVPALILAMIAVPTVKTIFKTEAKAPAGSLEVQVIGHQWWWEFRYPQYGVVTANELYLPAGRTANFSLQSRDVLHSFWTPELGGKRDLITNHTNYIWYTPRDS